MPELSGIDLKTRGTGEMTPRQSEVTSWIRPEIRSLRPYESARDIVQTGLLLDANEISYLACQQAQPEIRIQNHSFADCVAYCAESQFRIQRYG